MPSIAPAMLVIVSACRIAEAAMCPASEFVYSPETFASRPGEPVTAEADSIQSDNGIFTLEGNTVIEYQGRKLNAQNALYNQNTGELSVDGSLNFLGAGIKLEGTDAFIDIDDDQFSIGQSDYQLDLNGRRAVGSASDMEGLPNGDFSLNNATYSTCPPGDRSWYVEAQSLSLYPSEGIGTARNLRLVVKGIPVLVVPAFSFPISDKRKTGFLAPILAHSENTGLELHVPWYWNIRPQTDATITPRFMSRRGTQLKSELRHLNKQGRWTLDHEYLRDRQREDKPRYFTQLQHDGRFNTEFTSQVVAKRVSDKDYLEDLGDGLQIASITHLEQRADIRYEKDNVNALIRLQSFQTVDEEIVAADKPHSRLPQVKIQMHSAKLPLGLRTDISNEFVYFDKHDAVTGARVDFQPRLFLPIVRDAWFFRPSFSHRLTYYMLNNVSAPIEKTKTRNVNTFSIDGGLFFDRIIDDRGTVQTLEPRLFYLRVPFTDQSNLDVFDSSAFDFNISQLFRTNRFSGADRIADADQLSMALTTRIIDGEDGSERFRASIGQIRYYKDRRVSLPTQEGIETRDTSDVVANMFTSLTKRWIGRGNIQWNPDNRRTVRSSVTLGYRPGTDHIANVTHRVVESPERPQRTEQIDLSAVWKINDTWKLAGRWNYSLDADQSIESLLGIEYDSCCWGVRFAARRYISDNGDEHETSYYLQLVLKGLAPIGQNYDSLLENAVLGYQDYNQ